MMEITVDKTGRSINFLNIFFRLEGSRYMKKIKNHNIYLSD